MDYLYGFKKGQALFFEKEPVPCGKSLSPGDRHFSSKRNQSLDV